MKKRNKLHRYLKRMATSLPVIILVSMLFVQQVYAIELPGGLQDIVEDAAGALEDKDEGLANLADTYLPGLRDGLSDKEKAEMIMDALVEMLGSDWFRDATLKEKTDAVCDLLDKLGVENTDEIRKNIDKILEFEYDGQEYLIILEDTFEDLLDEMTWTPPAFEVEDPNARVDKDAVIMYGLGFREFESALSQSEKDWTSYGLETHMKKNCTIDDFKTMLKGNDLIVVEEHGNFEYMNVSLIVTEEDVTAQSEEKYASDLEADRIIPVIFSTGAYFCIEPSFFTYYYANNGLDGAIVWIGSCSGNKSNALSDAFLDAGAEAVVGHSEDVYTAYDYSLLNESVSQLIQSKDLKEAVDHAKGRWGQSDIDYARDYLKVPEGQLKSSTSYPVVSGNTGW